MSESMCARCGVPFVKKKSHQRFCTRVCGVAANRADTEAKRQAVRVRIRECPGCGVQFEPVGRQRFCTMRCGKRMQTRARLNYASPSRDATCWWCDAPFNRIDGRQLFCTRECASLVKSLTNIQRLYGVTREAYRAEWRKQNGACAVCRRPERTTRNRLLCIDHDHVTGAFRALLCSHCNRGIGLLCDDPDILARATRYVREHRQLKLPAV